MRITEHQNHREREENSKPWADKGRKKVGPHHPALGGSPTAMAGQLNLLERPQWFQGCSFALPYFPREYFDFFSN